MGPPGGGRNFISNRLMSRFNIINMTFPEESQINRIFLTMLQQHLADFDTEVKIIGKPAILLLINFGCSCNEQYFISSRGPNGHDCRLVQSGGSKNAADTCQNPLPF